MFDELFALKFHARVKDDWYKRAGQWRGLPVAIKTVLFQSGSGDSQMALVASEAAIASNLVHPNIVATYSHDICNVSQEGNELPIFKFYLIQVRQAPLLHASAAATSGTK
jgi:hypothetical protein